MKRPHVTDRTLVADVARLIVPPVVTILTLAAVIAYGFGALLWALPACSSDDGHNGPWACSWDASERGIPGGEDFLSIGGRIVIE